MHPILTVVEFGGVAVPIGGYGVCLCFALAVGSAQSLRAASRAKLDLGLCIAAIGLVVAGGFTGAALVHAAAQLARTGSLAYAFSHVGLACWGGLGGGLLALAFASRALGLDGLRLADLSVPAIASAHAIGRIGCFLGGCCYGVESHGALAVHFAPAVADVEASALRHPVPLYEAAGLASLAGLFALAHGRGAGSGRPTAAYFGAYAVLRMGLEALRGDSIRGVFFDGLVSSAQIIGIGVLVVSCAWLAASARRRLVRGAFALAPALVLTGLAFGALADAPRKLVQQAPSIVRIEAGWFTMGSDADDAKVAAALCREAREDSSRCDEAAFAGEQPAHRVRLGTYRIDRLEVSHADWRRCVGAGVCPPARVAEADLRLGRPEHPVTGVTWAEAVGYCTWSGGRLPTESEWERAARGGGRRRFPWGDVFDARLANHTLSGAKPSASDRRAFAAPVDAYADGKSAHGLLQMAGNVWELTADRYGADYYGVSTTVDPRGPLTGDEHVVRGGSWRSPAYMLRVTHRAALKDADSRPDVGFRCAYDTR